ncbi:MAG: hypothetical protein GXP43_02715 [bacterium]|nr:hypothetical protein [bacterium]
MLVPRGFIDTFPSESDPNNQRGDSWWCRYEVMFDWNKAVTLPKITYQPLGRGEVTWCLKGWQRDCSRWQSPVIGWTREGKTTKFRLYNGSDLLDQASFVCHARPKEVSPAGRIYVNPKEDRAQGNRCSYDVFFEWNQAVKQARVTYEHTNNDGRSEGEITWCAPGNNDCSSWSPIINKQPVAGRTQENKSTIYRLYNVTGGKNQLLSSDNFRCLPGNDQGAPTMTPTPMPTPPFSLELVDAEGYSGSNFAGSAISTTKLINDQAKVFISYNLPNNQPYPPVYENGEVFEEGNYENRLRSHSYSWSVFDQFLASDIELGPNPADPGGYSISDVVAAASLANVTEGVVKVRSNLKVDRAYSQLKSLVILVQGDLEVSENLSTNNFGFFLVKGQVKIKPGVSQLTGIIITDSDFKFEPESLNLKGSFIAMGGMDIRSSLRDKAGAYVFSPAPDVIMQIVKLNVFTNKVFRIFYMREVNPFL